MRAMTRAKLLGVRALSTILLGLALARPALAQMRGAPRDYSRDALWLTGASVQMRSASVSDDASKGTWSIDASKPVAVGIDWGRIDRSIGVRAQKVVAPLTFSGASCASCQGDVQMLVVMGTYRRAGPLFGSILQQIVEFGLGATQWSALTGRSGSTLPSISPEVDFTYSAAFGIGMPLGPGAEVSVMYDALQARHRSMGNASSNIGLNVVRMGARLRLGQ